MFTSITCFSILAGLASANIQCPGPATPDCTNCGTPPCKYVKDPKDCTRYFECASATDVSFGPIDCAEGLFFQKDLGDVGHFPPCDDDTSTCDVTCQCFQTCIENGQVSLYNLFFDQKYN
ncbi:unnamed protein product [Meganyctiphanes norvegica]|uniref:Chitin-binding type-2 domain-containing protein n=1 Tax=Meganyctiphanes norvegica TaxID=48144 RepID=A0AAV2PJ14_MEGNR